MIKLLRTFVDIALWRKGPQDLPASIFLLLAAAVTYTSTSFIQVRLMGFVASIASTLMLVDIGMLTMLIGMVLSMMGRRARFTQTLTAVLGVGTLLGLIDITIRGVIAMTTGSNDDPVIWGVLRLMLILVLTGRILMQALETGLFTGMALTFAIVLATETVASSIVPLHQQPGAG